MDDLHESMAVQASCRRVVIPINNRDAALEFYGQLLSIAGRPVSAGRTYFDLADVVLCLYDPEREGDSPRPALPVPVYLTVADLASLHSLAEASGASNCTPVERRPWGEKSFYIDDPCGNTLCFVEEVSMFRGEFFVE
jgi:uncharacterized glyoxalase superfamily protein PhnB